MASRIVPSSRKPPLRLRVFVWLVAVIAGAVLAVSLFFTSMPSGTELSAAAILLAMVAAAHLYPLHLAPRRKMSADTAPAFAAALLLPLPFAMLVSVLGIGAGEIRRRTVRIQLVYNVAVAALRAAAAAVVFDAIAPTMLSANDVEPAATTAAIVVSAVAMYLANVGLIDAVVAVQQRRNPLQGWWERRRRQLPYEVSLYLLGAMVGVVGARWPAALLLLAAPSVVVYRALRDGVAAREQTRLGLEELADVIDTRDRSTMDHSKRVANLARTLALRLGMPADEVDAVYLAARVHDVGTIGIKSGALTKAGTLTAAEWQEIRTHPEIGAQLVSRFPELAGGQEMVLSHHERWDGRGYPRGLRAEQIPLGGRIIAVADAFDAMTSPRAYRPALTRDMVRAELFDGRGSQFDPRIVDVMLEMLDREAAATPDTPALRPTAAAAERA
jgi:HD-GYP domain-containing protein (c-di-GMP phosphodiesterase class II)